MRFPAALRHPIALAGVAITTVMAILFIILLALDLLGVCHNTMEPQYVGHQSGAHARVACVDCHVGPGVGALVESKWAGTRQLWQIGTDPESIASGERRRMDCMDCHNRPAHTFAFTPQRGVDTAIAQRRIPLGLPFVSDAVTAVSAEYPDKAAALNADRDAAS